MTQQPEPQQQPEQSRSPSQAAPPPSAPQSTRQPTPQGEPQAQPAASPGAGAAADIGTKDAGGDPVADPAADPVAALQAQLAERTADLQRLQAEYVNYKRRVDRDRNMVRESATATVLGALLPVLDDVDRARVHGELTGGFKAVAEALERTVTALGLVSFGEPGEPFDPRVHEALLHELSDEVAGPTAKTILQPGYRVGDRIVRPARVAVAEPATTVAATTLDEAEAAAGPGPVDADVAGPDIADDALDDAAGGAAGDLREGADSSEDDSRQ